eukprot:PITA_30312
MEIYMDDFTPYGSNSQEALSNLGKVLDKCIEMNLSLSLEKCEFLMTKGTVLGHAISQQGLQVDLKKIAIIQKVPPPQKFDLTIVDKPGKENVVVDFLSRVNLPAGEKGMVDDQMPDEHLFSLLVLSPWFVDIANYLVLAQFPPHLSSKEKSKIVRKSAPFTWIRGNLFKLGPDQILRRCVREEEVFDILLTCHDGPCGGHFAGKRTTFKILQASYCWPTLHQDVKRYISQCDQCQRMGKPTPEDEMPLQPQVTFEPFEKWAMDFVGPVNPPSKQKQYIIMCTYYLTKWAETKAIKATTEEKVAEFLRENIFYKFGYPGELVTDQGIQFTSNLIEDLLTHHKIKHRTSTPYHPQANGQVEVTNRALEGILTKVVSNNRKDWADRLVEATWTYNTTWKTTTRFTPYELLYGKKALLSIEFEYNTQRMEAQLDLDLNHA